MMGPQQIAQGKLFYEFSLEVMVPPDHLLRAIDQFVDLSDVRPLLAPTYSSTGSAICRSRVDDADVVGRLLLRDPLRTAAMRGSWRIAGFVASI